MDRHKLLHHQLDLRSGGTFANQDTASEATANILVKAGLATPVWSSKRPLKAILLGGCIA
jgi:hypothetical protein